MDGHTKLLLNPSRVTSYTGFQEAYLDNTQAILCGESFCNAPRGFPSQELLGVAFQPRNPRDRLITHPSRRSR